MGGFGGNSAAIRLVAGMLAVLGVAIALWGIRGMMDTFDEIETVEIPGSTTLSLSEGKKTIYYDMDDGLAPSAGLLQERVRISGPQGGNIPVEVGGGGESLSTPTRDLEGLLTFEVPREGDYTVTVDDVSLLPPGKLAVGPGFFATAWRFLLATIGGAIMALGGVIAMFTSVVSGKGKAGPVPSRTNRPEKKGGWGRKKHESEAGWGSDRDGGADDMWGDSHDWTDEFDPEQPPAPQSGRDDGWGSGRNEQDDLWRRPPATDHDDGMPPPPSSF